MLTTLAMTCLMEVAYYEARNQPEPAQFAVVEVALRRVKDWRWKDDPCSVVYAPAQYEWAIDKPEKKPEEHHSWLLAGEIVGILVRSGKYSATRCADHHHDISVTPDWTKRMDFEIQIGDIRFYCSDPEDWRRPK